MVLRKRETLFSWDTVLVFHAACEIPISTSALCKTHGAHVQVSMVFPALLFWNMEPRGYRGYVFHQAVKSASLMALLQRDEKEVAPAFCRCQVMVV